MWSFAALAFAASFGAGSVEPEAAPLAEQHGRCTAKGCSAFTLVRFAEAEPRAHRIELEFEGQLSTCWLTAGPERARSGCLPDNRDVMFGAVRVTEEGFDIQLDRTTKRWITITIHSEGAEPQVLKVAAKYEFFFPNGPRCGWPCKQGRTEVITLAAPARKE